MEDVGRITETIDEVLEQLKEKYGSNEATMQKLAAEARRLFRYLAAMGVRRWGHVTPEVVLSWCWVARQTRGGEHARPSVSTARNRQWTAMGVFEAAQSLGYLTAGRRLAGERIPRSSDSVSTRPLTREEASRVRGFADRGQLFSRRAVIVALAFAGATSGEIAQVRKSDVDLQAGTVRIGQRENPICEWGQRMIETFLQVRPGIRGTSEIRGE